MKERLLTLLIIALAVSGLHAQVTTKKMKIYRTWISLNSEPYKIKGSLYQISDSSVFVSNSLNVQDYSQDRYETVELHIENIMKIKTRKKSSVGNGAVVGAIAGLAIGGLIGYASGDDSCPPNNWCFISFTAAEKAIMLGVPLSIVGAGLGALIGSAKIVIPINGNANTFNQNKNKLREYSIIK